MTMRFIPISICRGADEVAPTAGKTAILMRNNVTINADENGTYLTVFYLGTLGIGHTVVGPGSCFS